MPDKKQCQLHKPLDRLEFEHLVELPNRNAKRDKYDGFIPMSDDGLTRHIRFRRIERSAAPMVGGARLRPD